MPFYKYVIFLIFSGYKIADIVSRLNDRNFYVTMDEINNIYKDILSTSSEDLLSHLNERRPLDIENENHIGIMKHFGIYNYYQYIFRESRMVKGQPRWYRWVDQVEWITTHHDVQTIVSILLFNKEPLESVSAVLQFKFGKKVSLNTLELYKSMMWDVDEMSARDVAVYFPILKNSTYIVRMFADGEAEVEHADYCAPEDMNGYSDSFAIMDSDYVKWKLGMRGKDLKVPSTKDFLEEVKLDSMFKYKESVRMTRSFEVTKEDGEGFEGPVNSTRVTRRNVEKDRAKLMRTYLDMFIKADGAMPDDTSDEEANFFKNLQQVNMTFVTEEKILDINENKEMLEDIKKDM